MRANQKYRSPRKLIDEAIERKKYPNQNKGEPESKNLVNSRVFDLFRCTVMF